MSGRGKRFLALVERHQALTLQVRAIAQHRVIVPDVLLSQQQAVICDAIALLEAGAVDELDEADRLRVLAMIDQTTAASSDVVAVCDHVLDVLGSVQQGLPE